MDREALAAKQSPRPKRKKQPLTRHRADWQRQSSSSQSATRGSLNSSTMRLASMLRGASEREEPTEAPAPATSPRHKQRWKSALAFAKTQTSEDRGPAVFSHQGPDGAWEPYDAARCLEIQAAINAQGPDGAVQLAGIPFEVRWGARATSSRVATCVEIKFTARLR